MRLRTSSGVTKMMRKKNTVQAMAVRAKENQLS